MKPGERQDGDGNKRFPMIKLVIDLVLLLTPAIRYGEHFNVHVICCWKCV